jgi:glycolate oxidase FAD binding subunit
MIESEDQLIEAVRAARAAGTPLEIIGAGTKRGFGRPVSATPLDLSALAGIVAYEPEELVLTLKPATRVAEIAALLAARNQCLGFDPPDWGPLFGAPPDAGTIGGTVTADLSGPAAIRHGRARDHLLGFRAVNGLGEAYKAGGRVVKNVTGFDLSKLMCGAMGTLGPLTELTLRVYPKAPLRAVLAVRGCGADEGLALLRRVWSSPLESTGLAYRSKDDVALIRLDGEAEALAGKIAWLKAMPGAKPAEEIEDGDRSFRALADGTGFITTKSNIWRVSLPPANAAALIAALAPRDWYADLAGGVLWIATDGLDLHGAAARHGSNAVLVRAGEESSISPFAPEPPERAALTRAVKAAFDPLGLFNPGRMWEGV